MEYHIQKNGANSYSIKDDNDKVIARDIESREKAEAVIKEIKKGGIYGDAAAQKLAEKTQEKSGSYFANWNGERFTVGTKKNNDPKSYPITGGQGYDYALQYVTEANNRLQARDRAQDDAQYSAGGTARDDQLEHQNSINVGNEIEKGENPETADKKGAKETVEQKKKEAEVNPYYSATEQNATSTATKKKIEEDAGEELPDVSEYKDLGNKLLGESGGKVEKPDLDTSGKKLDLDAGYSNGQEEPSNKDLNEEAKENPEDVVEEVKDDPETRKKLLNDYKAGRLDPYPILKAVVDIISNNARMNMDRAALLTGGQRDLDAYKPIETEIDAIREKQQDARATIGMSLDEAMNRAKDGDYTGLSKAVANGLISVENAAAALNMAPEDLANKWSNETVKDTESTKQTELTTKKQEQDLKQSSLSMINELEKEKTANNEMIKALAGHDVDSFNKAVQAYRGALQGISSVSDVYTEQSESGGEASGEAKLFGTIGADAKGTWNSGNSSTQTGQKDAYLDANIEEILKKGNEAMKASDTANTEFVKKLEARNAQIDRDIANLRKEAKLGMDFKYKAK